MLALPGVGALFYTLRQAARRGRCAVRDRVQPAEILRVQDRPRVGGSRQRRRGRLPELDGELSRSFADSGRRYHVGLEQHVLGYIRCRRTRPDVVAHAGALVLVVGESPRLPSRLQQPSLLPRSVSLSVHLTHVPQPAPDRRAAANAETTCAHARRRRPASGRRRLGPLRGGHHPDANRRRHRLRRHSDAGRRDADARQHVEPPPSRLPQPVLLLRAHQRPSRRHQLVGQLRHLLPLQSAIPRRPDQPHLPAADATEQTGYGRQR